MWKFRCNNRQSGRNNSSSRKRGFSLVELVVIIGVLAILIAISAPTLLGYMERTRMGKDESKMDEVVDNVFLALADQYTFDEAAYYSAVNNFVTYTDSSGTYGSKLTDSEYWAPDGSGKATTITFNPSSFGSGKYVIADAYVNDMTYDNGSTASTRLMIGCAATNPQVQFDEMQSGHGITTAYLCTAIQQAMGQFIQLESNSYSNSSYTIFILFGTNTANGSYVTVKGSFNGTNLIEGASAAFGSGTDSYDDQGNAQGTQSGKGEASFAGSALTGSGDVSYHNYQVCAGTFDKEKFWAFCNSVSDQPVEAIGFSANGLVGEYLNTADVSVEGDGSICAWYNEGVIYVSPKQSGYVVALPEDASYLFDSTKTNLVNLTQINVAFTNVTDTLNLTNVFANNPKVVNIAGLQNWETENVVSVAGMFRGNSALQTVRVEHFRLPACEDMSYMFANCSKLGAITATDWDIKMVRDMSYAFFECGSLKSLDVSNFLTSPLTNLAHTFDGCVNVVEFDLSGWDVTSVSSFNSTFKDCKSADIINIEGWETSVATDMGSMFENCRAVLALDTAKFTTDGVSNLSKMFSNCVHLESLDLSSFNTTRATNVSDMFTGMLRLREVQVGASFSFFGNGYTRCILPTPSAQYIVGASGNWIDAGGKAWKAENIPSRTAGIYVAIETSLPAVLAPRNTWWRGKTDPSSITTLIFANINGAPRVYQEVFNADAQNNGDIKVYINGKYAYVINCKDARAIGSILLSSDASNMFSEFTSLTSMTGLRALNTINVTKTDNMFGKMVGPTAVGCTKLAFADGLSSWNMQNVTSAKNMFTGIAIKDLDLSRWSFSSLTNMDSMFENTSIEALNLSGWDVSNVGSFQSMFANSKRLNSITLKGWNNEGAAMDSMYSGCTSLVTILVSNDIKASPANDNMFSNCRNIRGGYGSAFAGPGSEYAIADSDAQAGYYTKFTASGNLSVRLYDSGSVSGMYTLLTEEGAVATDWDFSKGERLLEISLSGMPKGEEKTLTITVPVGMYILKDSWTGVSNDISAVSFEKLQNQGTGSYSNNQTGTLTYVIAPYTQNTTIKMMVMFDTTLWDKNKANADYYGTDAMTLDDPIVVSLNNGDRVRKISKVRSAVYFGSNSTGYSLTSHDSNSNIFVGQPLPTSKSAINFSTGTTTLIQYFKHVDYYIYAYSENASGQRIYANVTRPTSSGYYKYNWIDMNMEILDECNVSTYNSKCQVAGTVAAKNVLHMEIDQVHTTSGMSFPLPAFTITEEDGFVVGKKLTVVFVAEVETFNGQTKKMSSTKSYTIKSDKLNYQSDLSISSSGVNAPSASYFADSGFCNLQGSFQMSWSGAQDLTGMNVKYEYDINTTSGAPLLKVHAARVSLPASSSTNAQVVLVSESGKITSAYTVKITSSGDSSGAYVSAAKVASDNGLSGTYYVKSIAYEMPKVTGSTTKIHYLYANSSNNSLSSAGIYIGTIEDGASATSKLTVTFPDGTSKTSTRKSQAVSSVSYSGAINKVEMPNGSTVIAGNDFEIDVQLLAVSYPYTNAQLFKNPELYVVLPQGVSINGVIIGNSKTTATSKAEPIITLVKTTTIDGVVQNVYKISFAEPVWFGYAKAGATSVTSIGQDNQWVRLMLGTDSGMSNTTIRIINSLWFKDANGHISIGGSWRYGMSKDTYDVDNDGSTTDQFGIAGASNLANLSITITPQ